jgi:hypothetical protein
MTAMKRAFLITLLLVGCQKAANGDDTVVDAPAPGDAPEQVTDVTTNVTTDTTWSGLVKVHNSITVSAGVTLTVAPSTRIQLASAADITVAGTVTIGGTKTGPVVIEDLTPGVYWGVFASTSGTINMTYVQQIGGGFGIGGTAHLTVRDSTFSHVTHDLLVVSGGTIDMQYSGIGVAEGHTDSTHCDMHFEGGTPMITVSHSNISTAVYGMMFYAGPNANFTYNNWFSNTTDIERFPPATGDVSHGYFKAGNPNISGVTANTMSGTIVTDAGPR